jgi:hypothetical protein
MSVSPFAVVGDALGNTAILVDMPTNTRLTIPATQLQPGVSGFAPLPKGFTGGVTVAAGDINADSIPDIITAPAKNAPPLVRVYNAFTGKEERNFFAYDPGFYGGVNLAAGDVNGDGKTDIITGTASGGVPLVNVFDGATGRLTRAFFAYDPAFRGGVTVAAADTNGDHKADIVTGTGLGGVPLVNVFSGSNAHLLHAFFAFNPSFLGGVTVAAGDLDGDGKADIVVGNGVGADNEIRTYDGPTAILRNQVAVHDTHLGVNANGLTLALMDLDNDGKLDIIEGHKPTGGHHGGSFYKGSTLTPIGNGWGNTTGFEEPPNFNGNYLATYLP